MLSGNRRRRRNRSRRKSSPRRLSSKRKSYLNSARRQLHLEPLEARHLLSSDVGFALGFGDAGVEDNAWSVATDQDANVYVAGRFQGTVDFNPSTIVSGDTATSHGDFDGFVAKYDQAGEFQWVYTFGDGGYQSFGQVEVDPAGNVYVLGDAAAYQPPSPTSSARARIR